MLKKVIILLLIISILQQNCASQSSNTQTKKAVLEQQKTASQSTVFCKDILTKPSKMEQLTYSDTVTYGNKLLLLVTQDSTFSVYDKNGNDCNLVFTTRIDNTNLYSYTDGSKVFARDIDGDGQKEVGFMVEKNQYAKYRIFRIVREKSGIKFKQIKRLEELEKPEFDEETGLIRSHTYGRGGYEVDEYYKLSKEDILTFVKGFKVGSNGSETTYTTKEGW
jgi:hypothetical protein